MKPTIRYVRVIFRDKEMGTSAEDFLEINYVSALLVTSIVLFALSKGQENQADKEHSIRLKPGSTLIHDIEKSHNALIEDLGLESIVFDARQLMNIPDSENPLNRVNQYCRMLKRFLNAHSGFICKDLQDYLNLFSFIMNEPQDKHQKVEEFIIRAVSCRITHRYRS